MAGTEMDAEIGVIGSRGGCAPARLFDYLRQEAIVPPL